MMLVLNIEFFKIRPCLTVQTNPTKYLVAYIQHCSATSQPMFELTPGVGLVRTMTNLNLPSFSELTLYSI